MPSTTPSLSELYQLAEQLEFDKELSVQAVRTRDHALAADCHAGDDLGRLHYWLTTVKAQRGGGGLHKEPWLTESSAALLGRILAFGFGFAAMATFLFTSGRGLVNVFVFVLLFIVVQALLCLVAAIVMLRTVSGGAPVVLPVNPTQFIVARMFPDRRYLSEAQSVLRLLLLRFGQELGAIFTIGAVAAFFVVLLLTPFTFVWGSTYQLSDGFVVSLTEALATPWAPFLPQATVDAQVIAATRFHPAIVGLDAAELAGMAGWWPFLIMAMISYALLPRLLLWLLSKYFYGRQMRAAFTGMPGSELVLARMKTPLVQTQGEATAVRKGPSGLAAGTDRHLFLLNWSSALGPQDIGHFEEFAAVAQDNIIDAGLGSLPRELERLQARLGSPVERLYVAVKSWEPPMADLADFLANFGTTPRCTLFLVPLGDKPVSAGKLEDWQSFVRGLQFQSVAVHPLGRA